MKYKVESVFLFERVFFSIGIYCWNLPKRSPFEAFFPPKEFLLY